MSTFQFGEQKTQPMLNGDGDQAAIVDSHVHIHDCYDLPGFFDAAYENFQAAGSNLQLGRFRGVLLLTESAGANWFYHLGHELPHAQASEWQIHPTQESCSLIVSNPSGKELIITAGRQIVTSEKLEVLALGTDRTFADGQPIQDVLEQVHAAQAITVLPWGFGKWMGRRGEIMTQLLEAETSLPFYLGDNSGRLALAPTPKHFRLGQRKRIRILPGSDPLPFASEFWRPGSFGFALHGSISRSAPATDIKRHLLEQQTAITCYGKLENPVRFLRNQVAMQMRNRLGVPRGGM